VVRGPQFEKRWYRLYKFSCERNFFFKLSTLCVLIVRHFFLFRLNAHNILNTYIYQHLPPTCFGVCYTIFRETIALLAEKAVICFLQKVI